MRKGQAQPILGGLFYETGYPVTATLVSGAQMVGVDLMFRGTFRYHDSHGIAHGRSLATMGGAAKQRTKPPVRVHSA